MSSLDTSATGQAARFPASLALLLFALYARALPAADAALNWASLSGEQQYILAGYRPRWAKLDLTARRNLLARADAHSMKIRRAPATEEATGKPQAAAGPSSARKSTRRRRALSVAEAGLSAHSLRLRRALRELPGLSANERRAVLDRWGGLSGPQRVLLVDRYMHNIDDDDELELQSALRDGTISNDDLRRGLAAGKLEAGDVKDALSSGSLSTHTLKEGVASHAIDAEDLARVMRDGNIESSELSNAIEHNLPPAAAAASSAAPAASGR